MLNEEMWNEITLAERLNHLLVKHLPLSSVTVSLSPPNDIPLNVLRDCPGMTSAFEREVKS